MRIGPVGEDGVGGRADRDLRQRFEIDQRELGVGLADVDDGDVAGIAHFIWKTVSSGTATGSLSGFVSMMSAICAHQRFITGWFGRSSIVWSLRRQSTPKSVFVSSSRWIE